MTTDRANTGIDGLDDILGGGLPRNRIYLVQGDPGVGKTTLALQFLLAGRARGEKTLYISLSETEEEIRDVAASHGWDLDGVDIFELSAVQQALDMDATNTLFEPSEVELQETTRTLLDRVEKVNPTRVVFDSLSELRLLAQSALRYRRQVLAFKQYFSQHRSTVLFLDDHSSERHDLQLQSLAHGVMALEQRALVYGDDRRRLRIVKLRGLKFRTGYHDFTVVTGGVVVFPRLVAAEHHAVFQLENISSGIAGLDAVLGGGLSRGTSTLIMGPAGCGKSAIATQYAVAAARRGDHAAIFAFEEGAATLFARARALGMGLDEEVAAGRVHVQQVDPAAIGPGEFAHVARRQVEQNHSKVVVIDSLNGYLNSMPEDHYLSMQMHELLSYFAQKGVTTILVMAQHGMLGKMDSPVDVSYLADSVLLLRYFEAGGRIRKAISVIKKRSGIHEDTIRDFSMGPGGLQVGETLSDLHGVLSGIPTLLGSNAKQSG